MSPTPDSPSPLRSAPERSDPTPELLRSAPEHINIVAPTLQTPLIHMIFPPSCVSHTFGALRPHSGALRSAPEHINIITPTLQTPLIHVFFPQHTVFPHTLEGYLSISLTNNKSNQHKTSNRFHKEYVYFL